MTENLNITESLTITSTDGRSWSSMGEPVRETNYISNNVMFAMFLETEGQYFEEGQRETFVEWITKAVESVNNGTFVSNGIAILQHPADDTAVAYKVELA